MKHIYATFTDPNMAEKAGASLVAHGVDQEHISIFFPENYTTTIFPDYRSKASKKGMEGENPDVAKSGETTTTAADPTAGAATAAGTVLGVGPAVVIKVVFVDQAFGGGAMVTVSPSSAEYEHVAIKDILSKFKGDAASYAYDPPSRVTVGW